VGALEVGVYQGKVTFEDFKAGVASEAGEGDQVHAIAEAAQAEGAAEVVGGGGGGDARSFGEAAKNFFEAIGEKTVT
jgi:hypothetical protein